MKWIIKKTVEAATLTEAIKLEPKGIVVEVFPADEVPAQPGFKA